MTAASTDVCTRILAAGAGLLAGALSAGSVVAQLQWQQRPVFGRFSDPVAYDAARARLVLYTGGQGLPATPATWEWDGAWLLRTPQQMPPSRSWHALAQDLLRGRTVLFGGSGPRNDTWEWDGTTWLAMQPATLPPARQGAGMVFDAARGRTVMFGGHAPGFFGDTFFGDTWEWDGVNWVQRAPGASPPARAWHGMSFDLFRGRVVVFGGESPNGLRNDTWEWDGTNWALRLSTQQPSTRSHCALAFDLARGRSVMFGGLGGGTETWEWDGTNWLQAFPPAVPATRVDAGLAFDVARGALLMVGGNYGTTFPGDSWRFDGSQWTQVHGPSAPSARHSAAAAWDRARSTLLLFSGTTSGGLAAADTWQWDGVRWHELQPPVSPPARSRAAMAYDPFRARAVLFGGETSNGWTDDTWEWDGATWRLAAAAGPSPRFDHAMAFDLLRGQVLLFGGSSTPPSPRAETWTWDGVVWLQRTPALEPPPRYGHAMACDERRGVVVLFGGMGAGFGNLLADTWEWDGSTWLQRTPVHAPSPRVDHRLTWDAARERIVLSGGGGAIGATDAWDWDGIDWQQRGVATAPPARQRHAFAYDPTRECAVLFGGQGTGTNFADVWELAAVQPARATPFGTGCAGTLGAPLLDVVGDRRPWLGDVVALRLSPLMDGAVAVFALGSSNTQWNGAPLPAPLDGLGMPGCTLHVGIDETSSTIASGGTALLTAAVPAQTALLGVSLYFQGAVFDPGANAAGIVVSNALALVVGSR